MLLAASIENSQILLGVFGDDKLLFNAQIATDREKTDDEYAILIHGILLMNGVDKSAVRSAIVASVVRPLTPVICQAIRKITHVSPVVLGPGVKTGLNIRTDIPSQVGADIVANAVAAIQIASSPMVVISFGTATTFSGLKADGELSGVLIYPGVRSSLDALSDQAAELPSIAPDRPKTVLGKNTIDSMVSGIIYGNAAMIDGLLDRIAEDWQTDQLTVMTTGPFADRIMPHCKSRNIIKNEPNLTLLGLKQIYEQNNRPL